MDVPMIDNIALMFATDIPPDFQNQSLLGVPATRNMRSSGGNSGICTSSIIHLHFV